MARCCASLIGLMKRRVTIQNPSTASDGQGGFTETWVDGITIWASVEPVKGYERFQAAQMQTQITHKILTRYRTDITTASRLKFGTRIFEVKEVLNQHEEGRFLEIKALERASVSSSSSTSRILQEDGAAILLEDGGNIQTES